MFATYNKYLMTVRGNTTAQEIYVIELFLSHIKIYLWKLFVTHFMEPGKPNKAVLNGAIIAALVLLVGGATALSRREGEVVVSDTSLPVSDTPTETPASTGSSVAASSSPSAVPGASSGATVYKNGSYQANGTYLTPEGSEDIAVNLTITNDVVTAASISQTPKNRESRQYQAFFASGYKQQVVGKSLAELKLSRVSGSSLTPAGFNQAVADIRTQAGS
jgi:hypothetical protein